jgi:hypothetical protein
MAQVPAPLRNLSADEILVVGLGTLLDTRSPVVMERKDDAFGRTSVPVLQVARLFSWLFKPRRFIKQLGSTSRTWQNQMDAPLLSSMLPSPLKAEQIEL